jgi:hypothetical protein
LVVTINNPPKYGKVKISPKKGTALETQFDITGKNWVDPDEDYPLYYEFQVSERPINEAQESYKITT